MATKVNRMVAERERLDALHGDDTERDVGRLADEPGDAPEDLDDALSSLLAEHGAGGTIEAKAHVYIINDKTGEDEKIWEGLPADCDVAQFAKKHGSGRYRLMVYVKNSTGRYSRALNRVQPYRLAPEEDERLNAIREGRAVTPSQSGVKPEDLAAMVASAVRAAMPVVPQNNLGMLKEVAEIVRTLAPAAPAYTPAPAYNPMEMMRTMASFIREREEDEEVRRDGSGMGAFVRLAEKFAPLFERAMQPAAGPALPAAVPGPTPAAAPAASAPAAPANPEDEAVLRLKMGLQFLVMQAAAGNEAETYADVVIDNVPEDSIQGLLAMSDPIGHLATFVPDVAKHRPWFEKLLAEVRDALSDDEPADAAP